MKNKSLTVEETAHIAKLVQLNLSEKELMQYAADLDSTLQVIDNLNTLDTKAVEPTYQTTGLKNRFQTEQVDERNLSQQEALQNAAIHEDGLFKIPAIDYKK